MIIHTVLLQPKAETTPEEMESLLDQVRSMQQDISGIVDIQAGKNLSVKHQGYTYGFIIRFLDEDLLKAYAAPHPAHRIVSTEIRRTCSRVIDFDIFQD
jgi:hypothetical protein